MKTRIDLNSVIFEGMNRNLQSAISAVLREVHKENFRSGDITLKLTIGSTIEYTDVPDGIGGITRAPYNAPVFAHKINIALQKKDSLEGVYIAKGQQLESRDGVFELKDVNKAQIEMEIEND